MSTVAIFFICLFGFLSMCVIGYAITHIAKYISQGVEKEYCHSEVDWIKVEDELPSADNGYVDEIVLICVKNKNKEDGIYLIDVCSFDGESWGIRFSTWEKITHWRSMPEPPKEQP